MPKKDERTTNKRKSNRVAILTLRYKVVSGWDKNKASRFVLGIVQNISPDGLCLRTNTLEIDGLHISFDDTPLVRNKLRIELDLPSSRNTINLEGEVEWYEKEPGKNRDFYNVGVSFVKLKDEDRKTLKEYIKTIEEFTQ
jgi:hypothetical protein